MAHKAFHDVCKSVIVEVKTTNSGPKITRMTWDFVDDVDIVDELLPADLRIDPKQLESSTSIISDEHEYVNSNWQDYVLDLDRVELPYSTL
jgi:hypothetical protein